MDYNEFQLLWSQMGNDASNNSDVKISVRKILEKKHQKKWNLYVCKAWYQLLLLFLIMTTTIYLLFFYLKIEHTTQFWVGFSILIPIYGLTFYWNITYTLRLIKINYSKPLLNIKREISKLESFKIKWTIGSWFLSIIGLTGFYIMLPHIKPEAWALAFILVAGQSFYNFKKDTKLRYRKLQQEINEMELLEDLVHEKASQKQ
jgi:hypothetical protein